MDPTEALNLIRSSIMDTDNALEQDPIDPVTVERVLVELSENVRNLDEWLSKGGFLPLAWHPFSSAQRR